MTNIHQLTLTKALASLKNKEIKIEEIYDALASKVASDNEKYNIFLTMNQNAKTEGIAIQTKLAQNLQNNEQSTQSSLSALAGIPLAIKDNFATKGIRTTASSTVLNSFIPQYDSTVTRKLKAVGAVIQGKTNLDAWAHGSSTETSQYGRTLNPRNVDYLPGGSSGGSAAAVAADMCIASIGSETAGSIRLPASWCGVVGLKPTYGRVSRQGVVAMASSTDSPGPITKTVEDSAYLLELMAGHDPYDGTTSTQIVPSFTQALTKGVKGLKIGCIYMEYPELQPIKSHYETAFKVLEEAGAQVEMVQAMDPKYAISVYTVIQRGEVSSNLARYDGIRYGNDRSFFGEEAYRRVMLGTFTLSKGYADQYYNLAQKVRTQFILDFERLFEKFDVLIAPTTPNFALKVGASEESAMFGEMMDVLVEASSIAGLPAISVPCYRDPKTNLFLGLNIMAPMWREDVCIQTAAAYESATTWNTWLNT